MSAKILLISSLKGGTGKTSAAALIAAAAGEMARVLLVSFDRYSAMLDSFFGMESSFILDVSDIRDNKLSDIARHVNGLSMLSVAVRLPFSCNDFSEAEFIKELRHDNSFDLIIIDKGEGSADEIISLSVLCDIIAVVSDLTSESSKSAAILTGLLRDAGVKNFELLLNSVFLDPKLSDHFASVSSLALECACPMLGIIPYSDRLVAERTYKSAKNDKKLILACENCACRILGEDRRLLSFLPDKIRRRILNKTDTVN